MPRHSSTLTPIALTRSHDRFFRQTFGRPELAADFLRNYLPPQVAALLDLDPEHLVRGAESYIDSKLRGHQSDLLYRARLRDGSPAAVFILVEHKSRPDPWVALQLLRYMLQIWQAALQVRQPLFPILPLVVYHGKRLWRVSTNFSGLFRGPEALRPYWPDFRYDLLDLSVAGDVEIRGAAATQACALLLREIWSPDLAPKLAGILNRLRQMPDSVAAKELLDVLASYVVTSSDAVTQAEVQAAAEAALDEEGEQVMPTIAQTLLEQGRAEGRDEGERKGRAQGLDEGVRMGRREGLRQGHVHGLREGLLNGIELALDLRFGAAGLALMPEIAAIEAVATLQTIRDALRTVASPEALRALYRRASQSKA